MAIFEQTPGELDIRLAVGDDLSLPLQFSISLAGYTFSADMAGQTPAIDLSQAATVDTTASGLLDVTAKWNTASAGETITITNVTIEALG